MANLFITKLDSLQVNTKLEKKIKSLNVAFQKKKFGTEKCTKCVSTSSTKKTLWCSHTYLKKTNEKRDTL